MRIWKNVRFIGLILLSGWVLKTFFIGIYHVPSASMEPAIPTGSLIVAVKFPYVLRPPDTWPVLAVPFPFQASWQGLPVKKGQILLFDSPISFTAHPSRKSVFVKRLSALPGDTLFWLDNRLHTISTDGAYPVVIPARGMTAAPDSLTWPFRKQTIQRDLGQPVGDELMETPYTFTQDFYFFTGDFMNSSDSRRWGLVPADHLRGRMLFRIW